MWGDSIVGFGSYHYRHKSGTRGRLDAHRLLAQANLTLLHHVGFHHYDELLQKLGKFKTGKSCLYINKLEDVDIDVLKEMIRESVEMMREKYSERLNNPDGMKWNKINAGISLSGSFPISVISTFPPQKNADFPFFDQPPLPESILLLLAEAFHELSCPFPGAQSCYAPSKR